MIEVSNRVKQLFTDGHSHPYDIRLEFGTSKYFTTPTLTLTSADIKTESVKLVESLCSSERIKFGEINTSKFTCTILKKGDHLAKKYLKVTLIMDGNEIPYGRFYVESCKRTMYTIERELVAYDYTYFFLKDAFKPYYIEQIGQNSMATDCVLAVCNKLGLQCWLNVPHDAPRRPTVAHSTITYADIIQWAGEACKGWFRANREGVIRFVSLERPETEIIDFILPKSATYDEQTIPFDGVHIFSRNFFESEDNMPHFKEYDYDMGSTSENPYVVYKNSDYTNYMIEEELQAFCVDMLAAVNITYRPLSCKFDGRPWLEPGDMVSVTFDDEGTVQITTYVMSHTLSGLGALISTVDTKGLTAVENSIYTEREEEEQKEEAIDKNQEQKVDSLDWIITKVEKVSDTQMKVTATKDEREVVNTWNISESGGVTTFRNVTAGYDITFKGW